MMMENKKPLLDNSAFLDVSFCIKQCYKMSKLNLTKIPKKILLNNNLPSDRAIVSFTLLLMASSSEVVAVRTVPPSVSLSSFSSCNTKGTYEHSSTKYEG